MAIRILYLHGISEIGGAERALLATLAGLDRTSWQPLVACPASGPLPRALKALRVPTYPMMYPAWRKLTDLPWRIPAWFHLMRLVRTLQPALLHVNDLYWVPQALHVARRWKIPLVATIRQNLNNPWRVRQYRLGQADVLITVSNTARSVLMQNRVPIERIQTIYSGVDTDRFCPDFDGTPIRKQFGIPKEAPVVGCLANVLAIKGYDILLEAFRTVANQHPMVHCLIVGRDDSTYGAQMRDLASRLGVADRTHFAGFQAEVRPFLAAMDLVVLASRSEGLGIALLEAMAMAKPVAASAVGGIPEVVVDGVTGRLVPPGDSTALGSAILEFLANPDGLVGAGRLGRRRVETMFTLQGEVEAIESVYCSLLHDKSKGAGTVARAPSFAGGS
ncbi:glycosyltransferase [Nitrospiraceae bacterium AH_259_D15_M11_P09]|nr:glycosyltransferase [Nitrospiraceae bacterium AH_259_D15_M11_P09]